MDDEKKTAGWTIELLEAKANKAGEGGDYLAAITYHDEQILKALFTPSLLVSQPKTGSFALGDVQFMVFEFGLNNLENDIVGFCNSYLIKPLIEINFGVQTEYPKLVFEPLSKEKKLILSKYFALLSKSGVIDPDEPWIRDDLGFPEYDETTLDKKNFNPLKVGNTSPDGKSAQVKEPQPQRDGTI